MRKIKAYIKKHTFAFSEKVNYTIYLNIGDGTRGVNLGEFDSLPKAENALRNLKLEKNKNIKYN